MFLVKYISHSGFDTEQISRHRSEDAARKAALKHVDRHPERYGQVAIVDPQGNRVGKV